MDQLGMNQVPQVQFGNNLPKAQETQEATTSPYECKEDGDKN